MRALNDQKIKNAEAQHLPTGSYEKKMCIPPFLASPIFHFTFEAFRGGGK